MTNIMPANGVINDKMFSYPIRIYYEDTDAGGIVYYANYLKFAERARTEFLRTLNVNQNENLQAEQTGFVVRSCNIEYISSARLDDALIVTCKIKELGGASLVLEQQILRGNEVLTTMEVKAVHMSLTLKRPVRINNDLREKLTYFLD